MTAEGKLFSMAIWDVKKGREEEFMEAWKSFAEWTRRSRQGAMGVDLLRERTYPQRFVTMGTWESVEGLKEWRESEEYEDFFELAKKLCTDIRPMTLDAVVTIPLARVPAGR